jgi:hypothetical protein
MLRCRLMTNSIIDMEFPYIDSLLSVKQFICCPRILPDYYCDFATSSRNISSIRTLKK